MDSADSGLLDLTLTDDVTAARQLLADGQVDGIISQDPQLHLVVKSSGLNQTILKSFLDDYSQNRASPGRYRHRKSASPV
jgi:ABC-2 type transport system permease protein